MQLDEYLKAISECPDEVITDENRKYSRLCFDFGVHDNFTILLKTGYDSFIKDLENSQNSGLFSNQYKLKCKQEGFDAFGNDLDATSFFDYVPDISIQVRNGPIVWNQSAPDAKRQEEFRTGIILHPSDKYTGGQYGNIEVARKMASVIHDFCNYAMENNIPVCLPKVSPVNGPYGKTVYSASSLNE